MVTLEKADKVRQGFKVDDIRLRPYATHYMQE